MTSEVKKSKKLRTFLLKKELEDKFDKEVHKWKPHACQKMIYENIVGSFRFTKTEDGAQFWERINDEFEINSFK